MSRAEAQQELDEGSGSFGLEKVLRKIEAVLVWDYPDVPGAEIDARVARIRKVFLGEVDGE